jgi:hypothetical protein
MPAHLSFLDDATDRFLRAFELYEVLRKAAPEHAGISEAATSVRELYVALEKGFKHAVSSLDPYLLIAKPLPAVLLQIRQEMISRSVPTMFCTRVPFDTVGMRNAWTLLRELSDVTVADGVIAEFERGLKRLEEMRHRAQHGELYEEVEEMLARIEHVFARFLEVGEALLQEWLRRLFERNGQLEPRLRGIQRQIDAGWQVLVEYLRRHDRLLLTERLYVEWQAKSETLAVLMGNPSSDADRLLANTEIWVTSTSGLFSLFLTRQQADDTDAARRALSRGAPAEPSNAAGLFMAAMAAAAPSEQRAALVPLDAGHIHIPTANAWLAVDLRDVSPSKLHLSASLLDFRVEFRDGMDVLGAASGVLDCAVVRGPDRPERITLSGSAHLRSEFNSSSIVEGNDASLQPETTLRVVDLELAMTMAPDVT